MCNGVQGVKCDFIEIDVRGSLNNTFERMSYVTVICKKQSRFSFSIHMTVSTQIAPLPKSARSRNSDFSVSRGSHSNFGLIRICTEEFESLDLVDFGGVAFAVSTAEVQVCRLCGEKYRYMVQVCRV